MSSHHAPSPEGFSYPPLPGVGIRPPTETMAVETICFVFPGQRTFCRPWDHLQGAIQNRATPLPFIEFHFPDLIARVLFEDPDPSVLQGCWQAYLDGRLERIEERPGSQWIGIRLACPGDRPAHPKRPERVYPP